MQEYHIRAEIACLGEIHFPACETGKSDLESTCKHRTGVVRSSDALAQSQWSCWRGGDHGTDPSLLHGHKGASQTLRKAGMRPSRGINPRTGLRQGLLLIALPSQPRRGSSSFPPAGRRATRRRRVWHSANTRLFARWMNLSAMLCPSYVRKLEPAAAERLLPAVLCPKRSAGAEASPEVSPVLPVASPLTRSGT